MAATGVAVLGLIHVPLYRVTRLSKVEFRESMAVIHGVTTLIAIM